jgi:hypothetical protein
MIATQFKLSQLNRTYRQFCTEPPLKFRKFTYFSLRSNFYIANHDSKNIFFYKIMFPKTTWTMTADLSEIYTLKTFYLSVH